MIRLLPWLMMTNGIDIYLYPKSENETPCFIPLDWCKQWDVYLIDCHTQSLETWTILLSELLNDLDTIKIMHYSYLFMFTWTPLIHWSIQEGVYVYVYPHLHYNESICWSSTTISSPSLASFLLTFKLIIQRQRADSWYRITEITVSIQCLHRKK